MVRNICRVQDDVVKSSGLHQPRILISSFNEPNIYFEGVYIELMRCGYEAVEDYLWS